MKESKMPVCIHGMNLDSECSECANSTKSAEENMLKTIEQYNKKTKQELIFEILKLRDRLFLSKISI